MESRNQTVSGGITADVGRRAPRGKLKVQVQLEFLPPILAAPAAERRNVLVILNSSSPAELASLARASG